MAKSKKKDKKAGFPKRIYVVMDGKELAADDNYERLVVDAAAGVGQDVEVATYELVESEKMYLTVKGKYDE